jgi:membrane protein DedA with SNARE-associated domain
MLRTRRNTTKFTGGLRLKSVFEWITQLIASIGYAGVAILMLLENVIPPIPSELIMPLAGFVASGGGMSHAGAWSAGAGGSFAGAYFWFIVGRRVGQRRLRKLVRQYGRWVTLSCDDLDRAQEWFGRHGPASVFIGRLIPGVRTFISVPAGMSGMSALQFSSYTMLGTALWTGALLLAGHVLRASYGSVSHYIGLVSNIVFGLLAAALAWRYFQQWRHRNDETPAEEEDCEDPKASDARDLGLPT